MDFLLNLLSVVVWGMERHVFPLLVSIQPTIKQYLALMRRDFTHKVNIRRAVCNLKTTALLSRSRAHFHGLNQHLNFGSPNLRDNRDLTFIYSAVQRLVLQL